jgi:hypothetical protein
MFKSQWLLWSAAIGHMLPHFIWNQCNVFSGLSISFGVLGCRLSIDGTYDGSVNILAQTFAVPLFFFS